MRLYLTALGAKTPCTDLESSEFDICASWLYTNSFLDTIPALVSGAII